MIHFLLPVLAQVELGAPAPTKASKFVISDPLLIIGAAALIFAIGIFYVAVIRGPKQQNRRRIYKSDRSSSSSSGESSSEEDSDSASDSGSGRRRKKKRTRRREHRQRNPTLAQTGGLPPPKNPTNRAEFFG